MIQWLLSGDGRISIHSDGITLRESVPVINGNAQTAWEHRLIQDNPLVIQYRSPELPGLTCQIVVKGTHPGAALRVEIIELPEGFRLNSFGLRFSAVERLRAFLRNGYHSWDGSYYVQPGNLPASYTGRQDLETGYAMTQILPPDNGPNLVIGYERHDRFQQTFQFDTHAEKPGLTILTLWDQRGSKDAISSEWLRIFESQGVEDGLRQWAELVAENANPKPRTHAPLITGWCSWYNLYAAISEENILEHLRGAARAVKEYHLPMRVFQIDDGFTPEMGDWLEVKPQFPRGMKPVLDEIRAAGFTPGLWIAPFLVGNRSHLCQRHPDWLVRDRATGGPLVLMRFYGEFRWHKRSEEYYLLDVTHPDAFEYLRNVFRTWREAWGCEYFKTDFMYFGAKDGPETAIYHQPGLSRIEIWRKAAEMIRETIGDALWMGCGCPLWASTGLVDAVRIGRDVGIQWSGSQAAHASQSAQSLLRDQATRNFGNHILWQADPDSVLLREHFHMLTDAEIEALVLFAGMSGGVMTTSDDLSQLSEQRLGLWKLILPESKTPCRFPLLGQSEITYTGESGRTDRVFARQEDPLVVQVRPFTGGSAVFVLNTGEQPESCVYPLGDLGLPDAAYIWEWGMERGTHLSKRELEVHLEPHAGKLFWVTDHPLSHALITLGGKTKCLDQA